MADVPPADGPGDPPPVLALVRDLIFASRIAGTARQLGIPLTVVRDPAALAGAAGRRLIVDLNLPGGIEAATAWKQAAGGAVVGFVSHVDAATIHKARVAGVDRVMARSQFVQSLPTLLAAAPDLPAGPPAGSV